MCSVGYQVFVDGQRLGEKLGLDAWQSRKVKRNTHPQMAAVKSYKILTLQTI